MKKIVRKISLMLASLTLVTLSASAQTPQGQGIDYPITIKYSDNVKSQSKKAIETSWLSPLSMISDRGASFNNPTFFPLFQDSTVMINGSDAEAFHNAWNLYGTCFDPTDAFYSIQTGGWQTSRFHTYTVDSVRFPMSYIRQVDSIMMDGAMVEVVDTIILHFYEPDHLSPWSFTNGSDEIFMLPTNANYDPKSLGPNNVNHIDTILLTKANATDSMMEESIALARLSIPLPASIGTIGPDVSVEGELTTAFSISYKTMVPYSAGDTLVSFDDANQPVKKMNVFGTGSYTNSGARVPLTSYNNSFVTNRQLRYGQSFDPFRGYFATLSSTGWANDFYFDGDFHITADVNSINSVKNAIEVKVYPNPVAIGEKLLFDVADKTIDNAQVVVVDILGNVISSENISNLNGVQSVDTDGFSNGIYFIRITTDKGNFTSKFTVVQ